MLLDMSDALKNTDLITAVSLTGTQAWTGDGVACDIYSGWAMVTFTSIPSLNFVAANTTATGSAILTIGSATTVTGSTTAVTTYDGVDGSSSAFTAVTGGSATGGTWGVGYGISTQTRYINIDAALKYLRPALTITNAGNGPVFNVHCELVMLGTNQPTS